MRHGLAGIAVVAAACSLNVNPPPLGAPSDGGAGSGTDAGPDAGPDGARCTMATAAGKDHTCAVRSDGTVWCWGGNNAGQLGDGSRDDRPAPVQVTGLSGITAVAAGESRSCAIGAEGVVWCWGSGLLGDGNPPYSPSSPIVQVSNVSHAVQIVAGEAHSCARLESGTVTCWGENSSGQLGGGTSASVRTPVAVEGPTGVTALAAGNNTTCAVAGNQALWCWGSNRSGQLGADPAMLAGSPRALEIPGVVGVVGVAVGDAFTCAMTSAGEVLCFGSNDRLQLGEAVSVISRSTPGPVVLPVKAVAVAAGAHFVCVTEGDPEHRLWCWGDNQNFQLSAKANLPHRHPVLSLHANVAEIAGGGDHLCTRSESGGVLCSGSNGRGQIGDGARTARSTPIAIAGLSDVRSIAAGGAHTCALLSDKTVWCWGDNDFGQLGDGVGNDSSTPTEVVLITTAEQVVTGSDHSCARLDDGSVSCWGRNDMGQLGDGTSEDRSVAYKVAALPVATQISAARKQTCALVNTDPQLGGDVWCWGEYSAPNGRTVSSLMPAQIALPERAHMIAVGGHHTCALTVTDNVVCWGRNDHGQLGIVETTNETLVAVAGLGTVDNITADGDTSCAHVSTDNSVWCWGANGNGQLGNGDSLRKDKNVPQKVMLQSGSTKVAAGLVHSCAISLDKTVACWGAGSLGRLGDGAYSDSAVPAGVSAMDLSDVFDIAAGDGHTCAVLNDGRVACWGDDRRGQLGDGGDPARTTPTAPQLACP